MRTSGWTAATATTLVASLLATACASSTTEAGEYRDVMVHLFQWPWDSVARECTDVLGPAGFAAVQVSPPQEHVVPAGSPWWQDYQRPQPGSGLGSAGSAYSQVQHCMLLGLAEDRLRARER